MEDTNSGISGWLGSPASLFDREAGEHSGDSIPKVFASNKGCFALLCACVHLHLVIMGLREAYAIILYAYVSIRTSLAIIWLRLNNMVTQARRYIKPATEYHHKILVIGNHIQVQCNVYNLYVK